MREDLMAALAEVRALLESAPLDHDQLVHDRTAVEWVDRRDAILPRLLALAEGATTDPQSPHYGHLMQDGGRCLTCEKGVRPEPAAAPPPDAQDRARAEIAELMKIIDSLRKSLEERDAARPEAPREPPTDPNSPHHGYEIAVLIWIILIGVGFLGLVWNQ